MNSEIYPYVDHTLRVRFAETDAQQIVYYANYLVWFEVSRMEWLRAHRISWPELIKRDRQLVVAHAELDYRRSARYDDEIRLRSFIQRVGNKSLTFGYEVQRLPTAELLVTGNTVLVATTLSGQPIPIPEPLRGLALTSLERHQAIAGEASTQ